METERKKEKLKRKKLIRGEGVGGSIVYTFKEGEGGARNSDPGPNALFFSHYSLLLFLIPIHFGRCLFFCTHRSFSHYL